MNIRLLYVIFYKLPTQILFPRIHFIMSSYLPSWRSTKSFVQANQVPLCVVPGIAITTSFLMRNRTYNKYPTSSLFNSNIIIWGYVEGFVRRWALIGITTSATLYFFYPRNILRIIHKRTYPDYYPKEERFLTAKENLVKLQKDLIEDVFSSK